LRADESPVDEIGRLAPPVQTSRRRRRPGSGNAAAGLSADSRTVPIPKRGCTRSSTTPGSAVTARQCRPLEQLTGEFSDRQLATRSAESEAPVGTVMSRVHRGRHRLRALLVL